MRPSPRGLSLSERERHERQMKGESRILEAIAKGAPLLETLTQIVELVESQSDDMTASILLLDNQGRIRRGAAPSLSPHYLEAIDGEPIGPATGSCGTAMFLKETVITPDIAQDPLWARYRDVALLHGLRASWSTPILATDGTVLGALAQYYGAPCDPTPRDRHVIDNAKRLAEIAFARARDDERLRLRSRELEDANQRLEEAIRLKNEFVKLVAHELRTPLTAIRGYAEFLSEGIGGELSETQGEFVEQIHLGAERVVMLVDDLLDFARLDAGTFTLHPKPINLSESVSAVLDSFVPQAQAKELTLEAVTPATPVRMTVDPGRVMQVLSNLIGNALKHTPSGGRISVSVQATADGARVEVSDTGSGIAPVHLPRLFERFFQVDPGKGKREGAGLGLFISKVLVEAHGGEIGVESTRGSGSRFWFTLTNLSSEPEGWNVRPDEF